MQHLVESKRLSSSIKVIPEIPFNIPNLKSTEGAPGPTVIPRDETTSLRTHILFYLSAKLHGGVGASGAAAWRGQTAHPPLGIGVGVGDATGGWRPGFIALDVVRIALRLVRSLSAATAAPAPQPLARYPALCAARNPVPPVRRPASSPPTDATRGSTNRPNTTAAAGALKCRPSSFMRRASTQPTDGCCGRPKVRTSRKSRGKFARVRRRGRKRRKKRARGETGGARRARIHGDPRGIQGVATTTSYGTRTCGRRIVLRDDPPGEHVRGPFSDGKCARIPFSTMCSCLRFGIVLR